MLISTPFLFVLFCLSALLPPSPWWQQDQIIASLPAVSFLQPTHPLLAAAFLLFCPAPHFHVLLHPFLSFSNSLPFNPPFESRRPQIKPMPVQEVGHVGGKRLYKCIYWSRLNWRWVSAHTWYKSQNFKTNVKFQKSIILMCKLQSVLPLSPPRLTKREVGFFEIFFNASMHKLHCITLLWQSSSCSFFFLLINFSFCIQVLGNRNFSLF